MPLPNTDSDPDSFPSESLIRRMLSKGLSPSSVADILDIDISFVHLFHTPRIDSVPLDEEQVVRASKLSARAYQEAMYLLDEAAPVIKVRLIQGLLGPTMRTLLNQSPHDLEEARNTLSDLMAQVTTDDSDIDSIYSSNPDPGDVIYRSEPSTEVNSLPRTADDSD